LICLHQYMVSILTTLTDCQYLNTRTTFIRYSKSLGTFLIISGVLEVSEAQYGSCQKFEASAVLAGKIWKRSRLVSSLTFLSLAPAVFRYHCPRRPRLSIYKCFHGG
jgi:hypothetical protein